ncbi:MAG TPA: Rrf2 family transcriptional regulator [Casimicrobiaceae bacterium]|jgi:Rrf2 family nitric oxide-sensitive transcriptional repressor
MRLTTFSDYSLRALMYLGVHDDRLATIGELANAYGVSENHLVKVVHHLAQHGYIETIRGRGGGMRLARPPSEINVGEVVRGTEESLTLVECFDGSTSRCRIEPACRLKGMLGRALDAFFATLDRYTLADLIAPGPRLAALLVLPRRDGTRRRARVRSVSRP